MARWLGSFACYSVVAVALGFSFSGVASAESLELTAKFTSHPPRWEEGKASLPKDTEFTLPARVEVVEGSSENAAAVLIFKTGEEKFMHHCIYRGSGAGLWASIKDFFSRLGLLIKGEIKFSKVFSGDSTFAFSMCTANQPEPGDVAVGKEFVLKLHTMNAKNKERTIVAKIVLDLKGGVVPTPTPTATATATPTATVTPTTTPTATVAPTPTVTPTPEPADLPPDPGEAGKVTLEGIDSNGDGVRDDLERWIYFNAPNVPVLREALKQVVRDKTQTYLLLDDKEASIAMTHAGLKSNICASVFLKRAMGFDKGEELLSRLLAEIPNTMARSEAKIQVTQNFSGQISGMAAGDAGKLRECRFDLAAFGVSP